MAEKIVIADNLKIGQQHAIHLDDLCEMLGKSTDFVKDHVRRERINGTLICSDSNGYYLPGTRDEVRRFYEREIKKTAARYQVLKPFKTALEQFDGQQNLFKTEETV